MNTRYLSTGMAGSRPQIGIVMLLVDQPRLQKQSEAARGFGIRSRILSFKITRLIYAYIDGIPMDLGGIY